ncbi:hypothetical protein BT69DRAFT_1278873, partial [Atractiella rhizophila]
MADDNLQRQARQSTWQLKRHQTRTTVTAFFQRDRGGGEVGAMELIMEHPAAKEELARRSGGEEAVVPFDPIQHLCSL